MNLTYLVKNEQNLRQVLKQHFGMSDRLVTRLKKNKQIFLNDDNNIFLDKLVNTDDKVDIDLDFEEDNSNIIPSKFKLNILYEDDAFLIIDKPPNMPIHPSLNYYDNTLSNAVKYYFDSIGLKRKIRPINRLDKDTSGIVIFAKNEYIQDKIRIILKEYITIVEGSLNGSGMIDKNITRKEDSIIKRCIDDSGKRAVTEYEALENFEIQGKKLSLVKCILHTGRTHQIRLHMKYIGYPILGDSLYGKKSLLIDRQALHAYKIKFIHPITKKELEIISQISKDIKNMSKSISRVLSKVIIYLGYILLYISCHQIKKTTSSLNLLVSVLLQMGFTRLDVSPHLR